MNGFYYLIFFKNQGFYSTWPENPATYPGDGWQVRAVFSLLSPLAEGDLPCPEEPKHREFRPAG
jgi:hypothetical protein